MLETTMKLKKLLNNPNPRTLADLAEDFGVTRPTAKRYVTEARKDGLKIKTSKVRQGLRGPEAQAFRLA